ncbi:MAG TPA: hypothetical protein VNI55_01785 [Gaiellaceae bacterium]|nr:hypothetical protein [Gaiellaceae bacterium]
MERELRIIVAALNTGGYAAALDNSRREAEGQERAKRLQTAAGGVRVTYRTGESPKLLSVPGRAGDAAIVSRRGQTHLSGEPGPLVEHHFVSLADAAFFVDQELGDEKLTLIVDGGDDVEIDLTDPRIGGVKFAPLKGS